MHDRNVTTRLPIIISNMYSTMFLRIVVKPSDSGDVFGKAMLSSEICCRFVNSGGDGSA